ncbi:hypothetical protein, partial [Mesorhizobium sp. M2D.F.Ca.ET.140.01.1.1]|uniref:hypothetical protein n=1 Tax=Mesorhizobium sp. M2D.F.Ca.ET.140.01.1.1 TaxID=2496664 RepID=UPI001AECC3E0
MAIVIQDRLEGSSDCIEQDKRLSRSSSGADVPATRFVQAESEYRRRTLIRADPFGRLDVCYF